MATLKSTHDIMSIFRRRAWSMLIPAVVVFSLALAAALFMPRVYRSTTTILVEAQEIPRDFVATTVTSFAEQRIQSISQRIMSYGKLLEIINEMGLYREKSRRLTTEEIVALMRNDIKLETTSSDVVDARTGRPTAATIAFTLSYEGKKPAVVQEVANVLASLYLEENLKVREQTTLGTARFMEAEMKQVKEQLTAVDKQIADYKQRNVTSLPELAQMNLQGIDRSDRDVEQLTDQLRTLREKESYLESQLQSIPSDDATTDKGRLKELRVKLVELRTRLSDIHPDVIKVRTEIADLEKQLKGTGKHMEGKPDNPAYVTIAAQLAGARSEIDSVKRQLQQLKGKSESYQRRLEAFPRVEEGYRSLLAEQNNLQAKYDDLSRKFMEAKVSHGLEKEQLAERFTIIDSARLAEKPVSPQVGVLLIVGLIFGIAAGIANGAYQEYHDRSAHDLQGLFLGTSLPVLAAIPEMTSSQERTRFRRRVKQVLTVLVVTFAAGLILIHFVVMDLVILWAKLLRWVSL